MADLASLPLTSDWRSHAQAHPLHRHLTVRHGADELALPAGYTARSGHREFTAVAWPCPACEPTPPYRHRLILGLMMNAGAVCSAGCTPARILSALAVQEPSHGMSPLPLRHAEGQQEEQDRDVVLPRRVAVLPVAHGTGGQQEEQLLPVALRDEAWALDVGAVTRALAIIGVTAPIGDVFPCVLPAHEGTGTIRTRATSVHEYVCLCEPEPATWRLCDVRAARALRDEPRMLSDASATCWYRYLGYEAGLIEPVAIAWPELPPGARSALRKVSDAVRAWIGLRWRTHPGEETPLAVTLVAAIAGVTPKQARTALERLEGLGALRPTGYHSESRKRPKLYLPGAMR